MNPLLLHINYFEQGQSLEDACRIATQLGADGIEFRKHPNPKLFPGNEEQYLDALARALDAFPLNSVSFGTPGVNLMLTDKKARTTELEKAKHFYRIASKRFPVHSVNLQTGVLMNPSAAVPGAAYALHGSASAWDKLWDQAAEGLRELGAFGEEIGIQFALETHPCYLHDTLESCQRLMEMVKHPAIGILWDHTNLLLFPNPPTVAESFEAIRNRLASVHLKNFVLHPKDGSFVVGALSDGIVNIREQMRLLAKHSYTGLICLESPRFGDREWFASGDLEYLRHLQTSCF